MNKSDSIKNLAVALCKAQSEMQKASKSKDNPFFNSKYADLSEVIDCVKPAFTDNGLCFTQMPSFVDGVACVETMIMHESGEWISSTSGSPLSKQNPQGIGDATTYLRRYSLAAIAGLAQEDDDGNSNSSNGGTPNNKQDDDKPWYNEPDYQADLEGVTTAIRNGTPPEDVIKQISEKFKISTKYRDLIKSI